VSKSKTNGDSSSKSAPRSDFKRKRATDLSDEGIDTDDDFPTSYWGSWEEEVENIETVEKTNEGLLVYLHWYVVLSNESIFMNQKADNSSANNSPVGKTVREQYMIQEK